jgi:glycine betaine/proline transport system substrate-binding protein
MGTTRHARPKLLAAAFASTLLLSACGATEAGDPQADGGGAEVDESWADCVPGEGSEDLTGQEPGDEDTSLTLVEFNGWDDTVASARLTAHMLTELGYDVTVQSFEPAAGFTGVAEGDIDILASTMLPNTHSDYIDQYGEKMESQSCWFNEARNTIAVNEDSPAQTLSDLAEMGDDYDNTIVGIEPGAGLMRLTQDSVIPTYGLEGWELIESSTPAMLGAVQSATENGENIAVTMWHPHWAYEAFPLRDLEDDQNAFGEDELFYQFSRTGFTEENPFASKVLHNFAMTNDQMSDLQYVMNSEEHYGGEDPEAAVTEWAEDNPEFFEDWTAGKLTDQFN